MAHGVGGADEQGEYGDKLNNLTKFAASSKLDDAPWGDFPAATVTRDPAATIRELKEQTGKSPARIELRKTRSIDTPRATHLRSSVLT